MKLLNILASLVMTAGCLAGAPDARASERHFGFNYESTVLAPGRAELQPWTTERLGRADYYNRIDARLGFQLGLLKNLQAALFWNVSSITADLRLPGAALKSRLSTTDFQSLSVQLKYKLTDPVADALGSALLLEGTSGPLSAGYEGRVILDKQLGSLLLVANLNGGGVEQFELQSRFVASFGATLAAGYFVTPNIVTGLEARNENGYSGQIDRSVLYLGPSISFVSTRYWLTFAAEPQLVAFKGATARHHLDLAENEYLQVRLLLGFAL